MSFHNRIILLVEDEQINAIICKKTLEKHKFKVIHAVTGEEAVSIMESVPEIDLILMDIDLGDGIYGTDAAVRILEKKDIPLIFHSSHTDPEIVEKTEGITSYGYIVKNTGETVLIASIKMAFRLFEVKKRDQAKAVALKESEERFRMLLDDIPSVAVQGYKPNGTLFYWDRSSEKIFGYKSEEVLGQNILDLIIPLENRRSIHSNIRNMVENGILPLFSETVLLDKNKLPVTVLSSYSIIHRADGSDEIFCINVDITKRKESEDLIRLKNEELALANERLSASMKQLESANKELIKVNKDLEEKEAKYRLIFEHSPLGLFHFDEQGIITDCNDIFIKILESSRSMVIGVNTFELSDKMAVSAIKQVLNGSYAKYEGIYCSVTTDKITHVRGFFAPINIGEGKIAGGIGIIEDITEQKKIEEKTRNKFLLNDLFFKEIQHRFKNNLNTIYGLLLLQSDSQNDPLCKTVFENAACRMKNIMLLYDKLYFQDNQREINMAQILPQLIEEIVSINDVTSNVRTCIEIEDFELHGEVIKFIGIIINEMITNSIKHAFADRDNGMISVLVAKNDKEVIIKYKDNGLGFPESLESGNSTGFGVEFIKMLVNQMSGNLEIIKNNGAGYSISIPV